jgi:putative ABC transport system substrate-binding protein
MRRRKFLAVLGGAAFAWPFPARAQAVVSSTKPTIGFLAPGSKTKSKRFYDGFPMGMQQLGYAEGRDYVFEARYAEGDLGHLPALAEELAKLKPNVIVCGLNAGALAAKKAAPNIPIVGVNLINPVSLGLAKSEARPGTNVTGTLQYVEGLTGKQLEITRDVFPGITKIGILVNANNPTNLILQREAKAAAAKMGVSVIFVEVRGPEEIAPAFQRFVRESVNAVCVLRDVRFMTMRQQIASFALAARLPTIYGFREHAESGGLLSYGIDLFESYRYAASYVDRILKGEKPADLPIEFPTKLELVINVSTAKAIGLTIPPGLIARADDLIE